MSERDDNKGIHKIDGVHWVTRTIPVADGVLTLTGLSVRAVREALSKMDQDSILVYMFEGQTQLHIGPVAGVAGLSDNGSDVTALFGPEAIDVMKQAVGELGGGG